MSLVTCKNCGRDMLTEADLIRRKDQADLTKELERIRTQLAGRTYFHSDQAVEDTLSDLMTKYDALSVENVALREALKPFADVAGMPCVPKSVGASSVILWCQQSAHKVDGQITAQDLIDAQQALSNPSPQVAKIEAVLKAATEECVGDEDGTLCECSRPLCQAVRNLRGDK